MAVTKRFFAIGALLTLAATGGCTSDSVDKTKSAIVTEPGGMCPAHTTTVECRGETIANVTVSNDATHLIIQIDGAGGFLLAGADIHAGLHAAPRTDGDFDIDAFPFHYDFASPRGTVEIRIALADLGATCGTTLSLAIHVRAVRLDGSGMVIEEKNGFARSGHPYGTGFCFYYDVCCPPPDMDGGMPKHDAGMPEEDAGMPGEDAGMPGEDAGIPEEDGGAPEGCVRTQGYWMTHPELWPVTSLTIAGEVYTQAELLAIMAAGSMGGGVDFSYMLASQLIAAMLNVASGAPEPLIISEVDAFLTANADADGRLPFGFMPGTAVHDEASRLNDLITEFNEGGGDIVSCDQVPRMPGGGPGFDPDTDMDIDETIDEDVGRAMR